MVWGRPEDTRTIDGTSGGLTYPTPKGTGRPESNRHRSLPDPGLPVTLVLRRGPGHRTSNSKGAGRHPGPLGPTPPPPPVTTAGPVLVRAGNDACRP